MAKGVNIGKGKKLGPLMPSPKVGTGFHHATILGHLGCQVT